jgi:hypothetical protein
MVLLILGPLTELCWWSWRSWNRHHVGAFCVAASRGVAEVHQLFFPRLFNTSLPPIHRPVMLSYTLRPNRSSSGSNVLIAPKSLHLCYANIGTSVFYHFRQQKVISIKLCYSGHHTNGHNIELILFVFLSSLPSLPPISSSITSLSTSSCQVPILPFYINFKFQF